MNNSPDGEYNSHVLVIVEKLPANVKGLTVEKYLEFSQKNVQKIMPGALFQSVTKETISGKEISVLKSKQPIPGIPGYE